MDTPSFDELRATLVEGDANITVNCIAQISRPFQRCSTTIGNDRVQMAAHHIHSESEIADISLGSVRKVINYLVCDKHQAGYHYKNKIEEKWAQELSHLDFTKRRKPSLSSPSRSNNSTPTQQRRSLLPLSTPSPTRIPTPINGSSDSRVPQLAPEHLSPSADRQRAYSVPGSLILDDDSSIEDGPQDQTVDADVDTEASTSNAAVEDPSLLIEDPLAQAAADDPPPADDLPQGTRAQRRRSAQEPAEGFSNGDAASSPPFAIRLRVRDLLIKPLIDKGCIYAFRDSTGQYVKIGLTKQSYQKRLAQLQNEHDGRLDRSCLIYFTDIPKFRLDRLEKLVHADLAFFQRNLHVTNGPKPMNRREWFEVDLAIAQRTINLWNEILQQKCMQPSTEDKPEFRSMLEKSPAFDVGTTAEGVDELEAWKDVNRDHESRLQIWTELLLPHKKTLSRMEYFAQWVRRVFVGWFIIIHVVCWFLYNHFCL